MYLVCFYVTCKGCHFYLHYFLTVEFIHSTQYFNVAHLESRDSLLIFLFQFNSIKGVMIQ